MPKPNLSTTYKTLLKRVKETLILGQRKIEQQKVKTYWETGRLIHADILKHKNRATYGTEVVKRLAQDLGIEDSTLHRCVRFFQKYPNSKILGARPQLTWTHYRKLITIDDEKKRRYLENRTATNAWSHRELAAQIKLQAPEREESRKEESGKIEVRSEKSVEDRRPLTPKRGQVYTYKLVTRPQLGEDKESGLLVDLGFGIFRNVEARQLAHFSEGDIVSSQGRDTLSERKRVEGSGPCFYKFSKTDRTVKDLFTYNALVEKIIDGDTIKVRIDLGFDTWIRETLRLRGIDCAEMSTKEGVAAKTFVQSIIKVAQWIVIHSSRSDKYDRYLADVYIQSAVGSQQSTEEIFLNNVLLEKGFATRME